MVCSFCNKEYHLKLSKVKQNKRGVFFCSMDCKKSYYKDHPTIKDVPESARNRSKKYLDYIKSWDKEKKEKRLDVRNGNYSKRLYGDYWEANVILIKIKREVKKNERKNYK